MTETKLKIKLQFLFKAKVPNKSDMFIARFKFPRLRSVKKKTSLKFASKLVR